MPLEIAPAELAPWRARFWFLVYDDGQILCTGSALFREVITRGEAEEDLDALRVFADRQRRFHADCDAYERIARLSLRFERAEARAARFEMVKLDPQRFPNELVADWRWRCERRGGRRGVMAEMGKDYSCHPRTIRRDLESCERLGLIPEGLSRRRIAKAA